MATPTTKEILIHGFVRELQRVLSGNTIVPFDVIQLLISFYSFPTRIFCINDKTNKLYTSNGISAGCIDIKCNKFKFNSSGCFIPNISSYCKALLPGCDGVIINTLNPGQQQIDATQECNQENHLILFKSDEIGQPNIKALHYNTIQAEKVTNPAKTKFVVCEEIGMVFCNGGHSTILSLDLSEIVGGGPDVDSLWVSVKFQSFCNSEMWHIRELEHIHGTAKLFAIDSPPGDTIDINRFFQKLLEPDVINVAFHHDTRCNILDINTKRWTSIPAFVIKNEEVAKKQTFGICKQNKFDSNKVYVVADQGQVSVLDYNKISWSYIFSNRNIGKNPTVWMQDNQFTIHGSSSDDIPNFMIDIRQNNPRWMFDTDTNNTMNNIKDNFHFSVGSFFL